MMAVPRDTLMVVLTEKRTAALMAVYLDCETVSWKCSQLTFFSNKNTKFSATIC